MMLKMLFFSKLIIHIIKAFFSIDKIQISDLYSPHSFDIFSSVAIFLQMFLKYFFFLPLFVHQKAAVTASALLLSDFPAAAVGICPLYSASWALVGLKTDVCWYGLAHSVSSCKSQRCWMRLRLTLCADWSVCEGNCHVERLVLHCGSKVNHNTDTQQDQKQN